MNHDKETLVEKNLKIIFLSSFLEMCINAFCVPTKAKKNNFWVALES